MDVIAPKAHVIKHDDGRDREGEKERERIAQAKHNLIVTCVAIVRR